jgi:16S rRNA (uracil1498-N3)-methyltransferase
MAMPRRRFFVTREQIQGQAAILSADQAHHLHKVLRLGAGEEVELIDGEGAGYRGHIEVRGDQIHVVGLEPLTQAPASVVPLTLAIALIKTDRFEWILQKATELGVYEIVPLITRYCQVRIPASKMEARMERWRRLLRESAKQCRSLSLPRLHHPLAFSDFLKLDNPSPCNRILCYEKALEPWDGLSLTAQNTTLCIGPEGGWEENEVGAAKQASFRLFSLGPRILRAETAALVAVALIQFRSGN